MGNDNKKTASESMPSKLKDKCLQLFRLIDTDGSKSIDRAETLKFWGNNFAVINAKELFQAVDKDDSGTIEESEWLEFWYNVYKSGHSVENICEEVSIIFKISLTL